MCPSSSRRTAIESADELEIRSWPVRDEGWRGRSPLLATLAIAVALAVSDAGIGVALVALALLSVACWRAWAPVRFVLDTRGLRFCLGRRERLLPWPLVAGYRVDRHGVTIFPATKGRLGIDALRGIYIPYAGQQDALLAMLDDFQGPPLAD